ncbi:MAG TPA: CRISPR-associated endonuclease Cas2 [Beijerinckiaceae bacterium]|nr:CRISPR-associated endonuclease Cas2 [Beijerinckiaceae bacterium]
MWLFVVFDLPVLTKTERKRATRFRQYLLDEGFSMMQFSVYLRFTSGKEQIEGLTRRIGKKVPNEGKVDVLSLTDQQYAAMTSFRGTTDAARPTKPDQLALF